MRTHVDADRRGPVRRPARLALGTGGLVAALALGVTLVPRSALVSVPWAGTIGCERVRVDVAVSPELQPVVRRILRSIDGQVVQGKCLTPVVRGQEPQVTAASAEVLPVDRAPQVWIPDAVVWGEKVQRWPLIAEGSLASTPVVVATSTEAVEALGWSQQAPTWKDVLRGKRAVVVPDYQSQSESLDALIALWQSLGKGTAADQEMVGTVLAADRSDLPVPAAAIAAARSGSADAPLFPATEQAVAHLNATSAVPQLAAVYPKEGSPVLNYPIYRLGGQPAAAGPAVRAVVHRLRSASAQELLRQEGFRRPSDDNDTGVSGGNPVGTGIRRAGDVTVLDPPGRVEVDEMIDRVRALAKPSRILLVMDVSVSMKDRLKDGSTRIQLSGDAVKLGVDLLPEGSSVGMWVFAGKMGGGKDYRVLEPVAPLKTVDAHGETQRTRLMRRAGSIDEDVSRGGTSLYDTTIAALREMHRTYDPKAVNAIVLMTDGGNSDKTGADLDDVLAEIRKLDQGRQKVAVYAAGLGADADYPAMKKIAKASDGYTYRIDNTTAGQEALLDGLRRSRNIS